MALAVPLSRFTPRVGGGSAFFVRPLARVMRYSHITQSLAVVILCCEIGYGQGFVNLGFETTTLTPILANPLSGYYVTNATVPGWSWTPQQTFGYGDPSTTVAYNDVALDSPAVTLQGTNSPYYPAIGGKYSILLQGGSEFVPSNSYSAIWQTGEIPANAQSLIYWGGALQVSFNGQPLTLIDISNAANYTVWGMDISAYAGQTGVLQFTKLWLPTNYSDGTLLDNIQFSSVPVPEPSAVSLCAVSLIFLLAIRFTKRPNTALEPTPTAP